MQKALCGLENVGRNKGEKAEVIGVEVSDKKVSDEWHRCSDGPST